MTKTRKGLSLRQRCALSLEYAQEYAPVRGEGRQHKQWSALHQTRGKGHIIELDRCNLYSFLSLQGVDSMQTT